MPRKERLATRNPLLERQYWLSRRAFLRTMALAGSATAVAALMPGCAAPSESTESGAAPAAASEGPQVGGVYRLTGVGDIRSLDPPAAER